MEDKPAIDYLDYMEIYNEHSAICQQIERVAEETYTGIILKEMQKPKNEEKTKIARRLAKEVFVTGVPMQKTYDGDSVSSDGRFQHLFKPHKGMVFFS